MSRPFLGSAFGTGFCSSTSRACGGTEESGRAPGWGAGAWAAGAAGWGAGGSLGAGSGWGGAGSAGAGAGSGGAGAGGSAAAAGATGGTAPGAAIGGTVFWNDHGTITSGPTPKRNRIKVMFSDRYLPLAVDVAAIAS